MVAVLSKIQEFGLKYAVVVVQIEGRDFRVTLKSEDIKFPEGSLNPAHASICEDAVPVEVQIIVYGNSPYASMPEEVLQRIAERSRDVNLVIFPQDPD